MKLWNPAVAAISALSGASPALASTVDALAGTPWWAGPAIGLGTYLGGLILRGGWRAFVAWTEAKAAKKTDAEALAAAAKAAGHELDEKR